MLRSFPNTRCLPTKEYVRMRRNTTDSCIKVKDRPFAEGSRGCHALLGLDTQNLNAKERHFILPLVI